MIKTAKFIGENILVIWAWTAVALFALAVIAPVAHAGNVQCDFQAGTDVKFYENGTEIRAPKSIYGRYNAGFVDMSLIKGGTVLQISHIGGAKPTKRLRMGIGETAETVLKFPKHRKKTPALVSFNDNGTDYTLDVVFEANGNDYHVQYTCV